MKYGYTAFINIATTCDLTYQQSVRGTCQSAVVMDSAVEYGSLSRDSLLWVIIYNVPGLHVEGPKYTNITQVPAFIKQFPKSI